MQTLITYWKITTEISKGSWGPLWSSVAPAWLCPIWSGGYHSPRALSHWYPDVSWPIQADSQFKPPALIVPYILRAKCFLNSYHLTLSWPVLLKYHQLPTCFLSSYLISLDVSSNWTVSSLRARAELFIVTSLQPRKHLPELLVS